MKNEREGLPDMQGVNRKTIDCEKAVVRLWGTVTLETGSGQASSWAGQERAASCVLRAFSVGVKPGVLCALSPFLPTVQLCARYYHPCIDKEMTLRSYIPPMEVVSARLDWEP